MNTQSKNKSEIEGKLKKMALIDNIYSYQEVKDKINMLNKNAEILKGKYNLNYSLETELKKYEAKNNSNLDISSASIHKVKDLEIQLGVLLSDDDRSVSTLKDPMRETKNTFLKNQKQAEEFVSKLQKDKKDLEKHLKDIERKELEK